MDRDALVALCEKRFRDTANSIVGESIASGLISWVDYLEGALTQVNTTTPLWPWLETTSTTTITVSASARSGSLPTDVVQVDSVYNTTDDYPLAPFQGRSGQFADLTTDEEGQPIFYHVRGSTLEVYPRPAVDTSFTCRVLTWPSALSAGSTEPPFPETFHRILVDGALAQAYLDDGNADWHQRHQAEFEKGIERMRQALLGFRAESYPVIRDVWWDN